MSLKSLTLMIAVMMLTLNAASAQNKIIAIDGSSTVFRSRRPWPRNFKRPIKVSK
jgi:hypothetical protein